MGLLLTRFYSRQRRHVDADTYTLHNFLGFLLLQMERRASVFSYRIEEVNA